MSQELEPVDKEPFKRLGKMLDGVIRMAPRENQLGVETLRDPDKQYGMIVQTRNYVDQALYLLQGADAHDSKPAYNMAENSIDDIQQNLQLMASLYPSTTDMKHEVKRIKGEKHKVNRRIDCNPENIVNREYQTSEMELRPKTDSKNTEIGETLE